MLRNNFETQLQSSNFNGTFEKITVTVTVVILIRVFFFTAGFKK